MVISREIAFSLTILITIIVANICIQVAVREYDDCVVIIMKIVKMW